MSEWKMKTRTGKARRLTFAPLTVAALLLVGAPAAAQQVQYEVPQNRWAKDILP